MIVKTKTEEEKKVISVLTVDDHAVMREGLELMLGDEEEIKVIATARDGKDALKLISDNAFVKPDVIITDINMSPMDGIEFMRELKAIDYAAPCLVLTMHTERDLINQALEAGAWGIVFKDSGIREVREGIKSLANGRHYYCEQATRLMIEVFQKGEDEEEPQEDSSNLSNRELQILQHIVGQKDNHEIAHELYISARTVEKHKYNMLQKTNSKNVAGLIIYAMKHGLVKIDRKLS